MEESNKIINNKIKIYNNEKKSEIDKSQIKSINGFNCIGPCYPPNTIYYNPYTLTPIKSEFPSCPIKKRHIDLENGKKNFIYADKCNDNDVNKGYITFDVFSDVVQICTTSIDFLKQIYGINNIVDVVHLLSNTIDTLPIYTQRRLLKAIFEVYYKYIEFPKILFSKKILNVLNNIYKLDKLNEKKIIDDLEKIYNNSFDLFKYFLNK